MSVDEQDPEKIADELDNESISPPAHAEGIPIRK